MWTRFHHLHHVTLQHVGLWTSWMQIKQHQRGVRGHSIPEGSAFWLGAMNRSLSPPPPTPVLHFHFYTNTENTQTGRTENLSTSTLYRLIYTVWVSTSWCVFPAWQDARGLIVIFNQKITSPPWCSNISFLLWWRVHWRKGGTTCLSKTVVQV